MELIVGPASTELNLWISQPSKAQSPKEEPPAFAAGDRVRLHSLGPHNSDYNGQEATQEAGSNANASAPSAKASTTSGAADSSEDEPDDAELSPGQRRVTLWNTQTKKKTPSRIRLERLFRF